MTTHIQPKTIADLLLTEVCAGWTKKNATIKGSGVYAIGTVLSQVSSTYLPLDLAAAGNAKKSVAVLAATVDISNGEATAFIIARGAVLAADALVWPAMITDAQKLTAINELEERGIVIKNAL